MKNIYVYADGSERSATAIKSAFQIAEKFDAKVTGFFVVPDVIMAAAMPEGTLISEQIVPDMQEHAEQQAQTAENMFRELSTEFGRAGNWLRVDAGLSGTREAAAITALYANMIVIGRYTDNSPSETDIGMAQDLVVDSGRPVIIIPKPGFATPTGRRILIAWKESRESVRAVLNAIPFLTNADAVIVSRVAKDKTETERAPGDAKILQLLDDHGVNAEIEIVTKKEDESTSAAIFREVKRFDADLLVAGAYSRSRLSEGIFGGVSKSIFEATPVPALLSH